MKENSQYRLGEAAEQSRSDEELRLQHSQQVQNLQQIIQSQATKNYQTLREKDDIIAELQQQNQQREGEKGVVF